MSDEENSGVFSRRKDYERRVPVANLPLPNYGRPKCVPPSTLVLLQYLTLSCTSGMAKYQTGITIAGAKS